MSTLTLTLPAVQVPATVTATRLGRIITPGHHIPEKQIVVNPDELHALVLAAREAASNAYAPYSQFHVGAALIMADDPSATIHSGSNVENSSYGASLCAERTGLFHSVALGFRQLKYLAVSTIDALERPLPERSPCGLCRQAIKEFTAQEISADMALILIDSGDPDTLCEIFDIERLLPYGFNFSPH